MPHRRLARLPVPPGAPGVAALGPPLQRALDGGPAIAPVPVPSATVSSAYVDALLAALRPDDRHHPLESGDAAVVVATSGSTGAPRGVLLGRDALLAVAGGPAGRAVEGAHYLVALPVTSVGGLQVVLRALLAGTEPVAMASVGGGEPFTAAGFTDATAALAARADGAPLRTSLVPAQLARLLDDPAAAAALAGFDEVLLGGAAASPALLARAGAAGLRVVRTYGMTETAGGCVYDGAPLPGVRVQVSAGDEGDDGEIRLGGPVLALGYRLRPLDTADRFADGWFRTGDVGRLTADGRLTVTGRRDDVVQVRGTAVGVAAVEGVLAAVPGVRECAVVAVDGGDDGSRLVAFVVPEAGPTPGDDLVDRLRATVRRQLGPAAVPRTVHPLHSLPVLPGGKIDRSALRRRATAP